MIPKTNQNIMKYIIISIFCLTALTNCADDDAIRNRNPFILDTNFSVQLGPTDTSDLQFPTNAVFVPNAGFNGVYVINNGTGFFAWEATDPNHIPENCSTLSRNGTEVTCQCEDENSYNLLTGQSVGQVLDYPLLQYRVTSNNGTIVISN